MWAEEAPSSNVPPTGLASGTGSPVIQISKTGVTHDISQMDMGRQTDKLYPCI